MVVEKDTLLHIALVEWAPLVFTVVLGGFLANLIFPRLQKKNQSSRQLMERKLSLLEEISSSLVAYTSSWHRLMAISKLSLERQLSAREEERKMSFVEERNSNRDRLLEALSIARIYFGESTWVKLSEFLEWDSNNSTKRLSELPDISEWYLWRDSIISELKGELRD